MSGRVRLVALAAVLVVATVACGSTNWPMLGFGPDHSGLSPDTTVNASNVGTLAVKWTADPPTSWCFRCLPHLFSSAAVVNGTLYAASTDGNLYTFDAAGKTNCSGNPRSCAPIWSAATNNSWTYSTPAVVNGVVYIGSSDFNLYAFDAAGTKNCSGAPAKCSPLWRGPTGYYVGPPTVANGVVYIGSEDHKLYAFDAAGSINCSGTPKVCNPLWTADIGAGIISSPAVANGVVYISSSDHNLYAFDAAGSTSCSGTPKTCGPLWMGTGATSPAVANGVVYTGADGKLYAYDAAGNGNCSGAPKTCQPLWTAAVGLSIGPEPAVANGVVYVGSGENNLFAFDAGGHGNCSGVPKTCSPLWTGTTISRVDSAAVANGLVYVLSGQSLYAFDAAGSKSCSGTPKTCDPLRVVTTAGPVSTSPAVANGMIYFSVGNPGASDYKLYAVGLP